MFRKHRKLSSNHKFRIYIRLGVMALCLLYLVQGHGQCINTDNIAGQENLNVFGPQLCENMKSLTLRGESISDLSPIAHVKNVEVLAIIETSLTSLAPLQITMENHRNEDSYHYIRGNKSLLSLAGLTYQGGNLEITNNDALTTLDLEITNHLHGELEIKGNAALSDVSGLGDHFYSDLDIIGNSSLTDLSGMSNITLIETNGDYLLNDLVIRGNASLTSLSGLQISATNIEITDNENLSSLEGVGESFFDTRLTISGHPALKDLSGIDSFKPSASSSDVVISNNPGLEHLWGLGNHDSFQTSNLIIRENSNLADLQGFENMTLRTVNISNNESLFSTVGLKNVEAVFGLEITNSFFNDLTDLTQVDGKIEVFDNPGITVLNNLGSTTESIGYNSSIDIYQNDNLGGIETLSSENGTVRSYKIRGNPALKHISLSARTAFYEIYENDSLLTIDIDSVRSITARDNPMLTALTVGYANTLDITGEAFQELVVNKRLNQITNPLFNISGEGDLGQLTFEGDLILLPEISVDTIETMRLSGSVFFRNSIGVVKDLEFDNTDLSLLEIIDYENVVINSATLIDLSELQDIEANHVTITGTSISSLAGMFNVNVNELIIKDNTLLTSAYFTDNNITTSLLEIEDNPALLSIEGVNHLVRDQDEVDFTIFRNEQLVDIDFGTTETTATGTITIRSNPLYTTCCEAEAWVGEEYLISNNGGICSGTTRTIADYCNLSVKVYDKTTGQLLTTLTDIDPDEPAWIMYEGTEQQLAFSLPRIGFDRVIMEGENGYVFRQLNFTRATRFQFDESFFEDENLPTNFKIIVRSEDTGTELKSFTIRAVRRPILFVDLNRDQGRNFIQIRNDAITKDMVPAERMELVHFREELTEANRRHNYQALLDALLNIRMRTLGAEAFNVDVVAFGRAGLLARQYLSELPIEVNRYLTVNTPHSGAELEDAMLSFNDISVSFYELLLNVGQAAIAAGTAFTGGLAVAGAIIITKASRNIAEIPLDLIESFLLDITVKSVNELVLKPENSYASESEKVEEINERFPLANVPKHSIVSVHNHEIRSVIDDARVPDEIREVYQEFNDLPCFELDPVRPEEIAGENNNTYSSFDSQTGGLTVPYISETIGDYGNLDQFEMRNLIFELLNGPKEHFTNSPYLLREVPPNPVAACESFLIGEIISLINEKVIDGAGGRSANETSIQIDTLIDEQLSLSYEGELLSLHVFTTNLDFYEAELTEANAVTLDVRSDANTITPTLYMAYGITPDSTVVEDYYLAFENEFDLTGYELQNFELAGVFGDTLSYQLLARNALEDEIDVTLIMANDIWPEALINPLFPGALIAKEAISDTMELNVGGEMIQVYTEVQPPTGYFGLTARDSIFIPENTELESTVAVVEILTNEPTESLTFKLAGDTTLFNTRLQDNRLLFQLVGSLDFESEIDYSLSVAGINNEKKDSLVMNFYVTDINESPTLVISELIPIQENDSNLYVGTLSATDPEGDELAFDTSLPTKLSLVEDSIWVISGLNHEVDSLVQVSISATDGEFIVEKSRILYVTDVNEAPTNVLLDNDSIYVKDMAMVLVGKLSAVDEDYDDRFTYRLEGFTDQFEIRSDSLIVSAETTTGLYTLPITALDLEGLAITSDLTVKVERERILGVARVVFMIYPNPAKDQLHIQHASGLPPEYRIYDLKGTLLLQGEGTRIDISSLVQQVVMLQTCIQGNCETVKVALTR